MAGRTEPGSFPHGIIRGTWTCLAIFWGLGLTGCGNADSGDSSANQDPPSTLRALTFNTGTTGGLAHDKPPDDGYTSAEAALSDMYYGDGLAWQTVVDDTRAFFDRLNSDPDTGIDVIAFQEIFYSGDCVSVPEEAKPGFVCETWQPGTPSVAQLILGAGYQVACNIEKPDKCIAVRKSFATIRGCDQDLCLDALAGARVPDCGGGSRVGRAELELTSGDELTVVLVHGSSGIEQKDQDCRMQQFQQIFQQLDPGVDGLKGAPGANGSRNLILGDLNTDPGRNFDFDESAAYFADHADGTKFHFVTDVGPTATPTYGGLFNIDHIVSDYYTGNCVTAGVSDGVPGVTSTTYFDHKPVYCNLEPPK
ncbi:MAG: hypothetical protein H6718_35120 [Polyangiaceae bacterium]|nr:hypothetical protein [Myxococcales bacterium]MCB9590692.1 hypothetical protein [Polyangiaceae bacterium]